jgi:hypothetical protein
MAPMVTATIASPSAAPSLDVSGLLGASIMASRQAWENGRHKQRSRVERPPRGSSNRRIV